MEQNILMEKPDVVACTCSPNIWEDRAEEVQTSLIRTDLEQKKKNK